MARNVNARYEIKSHIQKNMKAEYLRRKLVAAEIYNKKYVMSDFYKEVAEYCGITESTANQIHNKNLNVSLLVAIKLSEFLNKDIEELWEVSEIENS